MVRSQRLFIVTNGFIQVFQVCKFLAILSNMQIVPKRYWNYSYGWTKKVLKLLCSYVNWSKFLILFFRTISNFWQLEIWIYRMNRFSQYAVELVLRIRHNIFRMVITQQIHYWMITIQNTLFSKIPLLYVLNVHSIGLWCDLYIR